MDIRGASKGIVLPDSTTGSDSEAARIESKQMTTELRIEDRERLESEAIEYLLAWHTERDPAKRSAAWHRMISAADDLIAFRENHPVRNTDDVSDDGKWANWSYPEAGIRPAEQ